jgi:hypothetical protein
MNKKFLYLGIAVSILFICFLIILENIVQGLGESGSNKKSDFGIQQLSRPIAENQEVILNNIITNDKKFACMIVNIKWEMQSLSKPFTLFDNEKEMTDHIKDHIANKAHFAALVLVVKVKSENVDNSIEELQVNMLSRIREKFNISLVERKDINIKDVKILKYVILDKKYEGEGFPEINE